MARDISIFNSGFCQFKFLMFVGPYLISEKIVDMEKTIKATSLFP